MIVKGKYIIVSGIGPGLGTKLAVHAARASRNALARIVTDDEVALAGLFCCTGATLDANGGAFLP